MIRLALALATLAAALVLAATAAASRGALVLTGTVGPGFTIKMSEKKVHAGTYVITVKDLSAFHNFHLVGPGVNKKTSVPKQGTYRWTVELKKGTYRFVCDPHATVMKGTLKVT